MHVVNGYLQAFFMAVPQGAQRVGPSRRKHRLWPMQEDWRSGLANGVGRPCHHTEHDYVRPCRMLAAFILCPEHNCKLQKFCFCCWYW